MKREKRTAQNMKHGGTMGRWGRDGRMEKTKTKQKFKKKGDNLVTMSL